MTRRSIFVIVGVLLACVGVALVVSRSSEPSFNAQQQAVLDEMASGGHASDPAEAAQFVDHNIDVLLSSGIAESVDNADMVSLFEHAFQGGSEHRLLGLVVEAVAEEGAIHIRSLRHVFADAVVTDMQWFHERINAPFSYGASDLPDTVRQTYLATYDFIRELMRSSVIADELHGAVDEHGRSGTMDAPSGGDARTAQLKELGRVQELFNVAQFNADMARALESGDPDAIDAAEANERDRNEASRASKAVWVAVDRLDSDAAVRDAAQNESFVNDRGELEDDLTQGETQALRQWAVAQSVDGGLLYADVGSLLGGSGSVEHPLHRVSIEHRR